MRKKNVPAVILGLGVNGLGIVRSLALMDIPIYGFYNNKKEIGRFSKYVSAIKAYDVKTAPKQLLKQLTDFGEKINKKSFLIPESDVYLSFISENREVLSKYFLFNIADKDLITMIIDKSGNMELALRHNVLIPRTMYLDGSDDIDVILAEFKFPVIIKPLNTFSTTFPGNKKNIIIEDRDSLVRLFKNNNSLFGNCIIQEIIIGHDGNIVICSVYFSRDSEPLGVYTGRKIRQYLPDYGVTSYGVSEYIPEVEQISIRFLKSIGYKGLATLEFARDIKSGEYYFLELNGRSYYHNMLFTDCNMNLSYIAYCDTVGIDLHEKFKRQREGLIWIDFSRDIASFWRKRKEHKIKFMEWLYSVTRARSFAVFNKSDILPFLYSTWLLLTPVFGTVGRKFMKILRLRRCHKMTGNGRL